MTRTAAKYADVTDNCVRCPLDQPLVASDGMGPTTDAASVVLMFRCEAGHCWTRSYRRADLKGHPAKATTRPARRHLADRAVTTTAGTTTTATTADCTIDCADEANMTSKATRQPGPRTRWCPDRQAWQLR